MKTLGLALFLNVIFFIAYPSEGGDSFSEYTYSSSDEGEPEGTHPVVVRDEEGRQYIREVAPDGSMLPGRDGFDVILPGAGSVRARESALPAPSSPRQPRNIRRRLLAETGAHSESEEEDNLSPIGVPAYLERSERGLWPVRRWARRSPESVEEGGGEAPESPRRIVEYSGAPFGRRPSRPASHRRLAFDGEPAARPGFGGTFAGYQGTPERRAVQAAASFVEDELVSHARAYPSRGQRMLAAAQREIARRARGVERNRFGRVRRGSEDEESKGPDEPESDSSQ